MRKLFTILGAVLLTASVFAQSPEKISYQAVMRDASAVLITNTQVGLQISILQGSTSGTEVYVETLTPTTNANGLISLEIGTGSVIFGDFTTIDWANGPYFIKTETDPAGGTNYTITGVSQLLSVPYALHANTAETLTGAVNYTETDPIYNISEAANITADDITLLANTSGTNTGDQDISGIATNAENIAINTTAIALNTAKTGITVDQANEIVANTAKVGVTPEQVTILENTSGTNTGDQDISGIVTNADNIATNTTAIALNTAKTGITVDQANEIIANTAKVGVTPEQVTILENTSGTNTGDQDGSETMVTAGTNVTVTGTGTIASPYVVNASGGSAAPAPSRIALQGFDDDLTDFGSFGISGSGGGTSDAATLGNSIKINEATTTYSNGSDITMGIFDFTINSAGIYEIFISFSVNNFSTGSNNILQLASNGITKAVSVSSADDASNGNTATMVIKYIGYFGPSEEISFHYKNDSGGGFRGKAISVDIQKTNGVLPD